MNQLKVALQVYTVRQEAEKDFTGTVRKIKELGYDGIELAGLYGHSPEEIRDAVKEAGLEAVSAHVSYQELMADIEKTVGNYHTIGCSYIAIPFLPEEYRPGAEKFPEVLENIKKIGEVCNRHGIVLLYHNHDFEFEAKVDGQYGLDYLYANVGPELLKTEIDTCWVGVSGVNPSEYIQKYTGRSPVVHLKDYTGSKTPNMYKLIETDSGDGASGGAFAFRAVGSGKQDFPSILDAAVKAGAHWVVVEQDEHDTNTAMEDARLSRDYLKGLGY